MSAEHSGFDEAEFLARWRRPEVDVVIYTLRPDRTTIWLPPHVADAIGAREGDLLTEAQFNRAEVRDLIEMRLKAERAPKSKGAKAAVFDWSLEDAA